MIIEFCLEVLSQVFMILGASAAIRYAWIWAERDDLETKRIRIVLISGCVWSVITLSFEGAFIALGVESGFPPPLFLMDLFLFFVLFCSLLLIVKGFWKRKTADGIFLSMMICFFVLVVFAIISYSYRLPA